LVTTCEPGARLVFTQGRLVRPRWRAFLASRPAATSTEGLLVFVQLVIAAITTEPWKSSCSFPSSLNFADLGRPSADLPFAASRAARSFSMTSRALAKAALLLLRLTRSCGRRGPARLGSTVERSSSSESL
jgi:hypothetical protein